MADTYPTAGLLRRLAALLYDAFLVLAVWMLLGYGVQFVVGPGTSQLVDGRVETDPVLDVVYFSLMVASTLAFYLWFWCRGGQTLGMLAWRLKVVDLAGRPLTPQRALVRFVLAWPAFFLLGLGYLWLYLDPNGDAIHDRLSGTRVHVVPKNQRPF